MIVFVDTSAFISVLDANGRNHCMAKVKWEELVTSQAILFCNNYILVETFALIQNRLGMKAVRAFNNDLLPVVNVKWIDEALHKAGLSAIFTASRKKLSLVDCVSFETMRSLGIKTVFTFDSHFVEQGFHCVP